jgi:hypothetical protein
MATLGVGMDPGLGDPHVLSVSPCPSCCDRETEWKWGRCLTPSEADARLIAAAPELLQAAKTGLIQMEGDRDCLLESHCLFDDEMKPRPETMDWEVRAEFDLLEQHNANARAAIAKATDANAPAPAPPRELLTDRR